jgi:hypothetical protein
MAWLIQCSDKKCKGQTWAKNIVDLIRLHCDEDGYFLCGQCKKPVGYVEKSFELQEIGEKWEPFLRGIIPQGSPGDSYQPFVFLVSYKPGSPVNNVWFS